MTAFAKAGFNSIYYAAFRPSYPPALYNTLFAYHQGPRVLAFDLGCGHGLISRVLSPYFDTVLACDPSESMIKQAKAASPQKEYPNIIYLIAGAEEALSTGSGSIHTMDMVVSGQAAHWFDYGQGKLWQELASKVRTGGTVAFWGYKDHRFIDYPEATRVMDEVCYGQGESAMGKYWEQPGRKVLRNLYKEIQPKERFWKDTMRVEYEPNIQGKGSGTGEVLMSKRLKLGEVEGYLRTFSAYHNWKSDDTNRSQRDPVDVMFERMRDVESEWKALGESWREFEVECEWGSVILMTRRK